MKNLLVCLFLVSTFAACTIETDKSGNATFLTDKPNVAQRNFNDTIANRSNPYDYCGQLFMELLQSYNERPRTDADLDTVITAIEQIAQGSAAFNTIKPIFYAAPLPQRVTYLLENKQTCKTTLLQEAGLSVHAVASFGTFISDYISLCTLEEDYNVIYSFIEGYEDTVISDPNFQGVDKKIILITTSIARYSAAARKKRPKKNTDPAWDFLICGIYGSVDGAPSSPAEAVTMALVAAIAENQ